MSLAQLCNRLSAFRHHVLGRTYFYGALQSHRAPHMKRLARAEFYRLGRRLNILEVGSFRGESAALWGEFGHVTCVDLWPDGTGIFARNMKLLGVDYTSYRGDSAKLLKQFIEAGHLYDIVYIDGAHDYHGCRSDLELGRQLVKPGGILCGDDFDEEHPGVINAVGDILGNVQDREGFYWMNP